MRSVFPAALLLAICSTGNSQSIPVSISPNVELVSLVFRQIEADEYNNVSPSNAYAKRVDQFCKPFKSHPVFSYAAKVLREEDGIGFDSVAAFSISLDPKTFEFVIDGEDLKESLGSRWKIDHARKFQELLKSFVQESKFESFLKSEEKFYEDCVERTEKLLAKKPYVKFFSENFDLRGRQPFRVSVGLLNGGSNYGVRTKRAGAVYPNPVIGAYEFDKQGHLVWDDETSGTIVHEFAHTITNPMVDEFWKYFEKSGDRILPFRAAVLRSQAYAGARTMIQESLVRATTVWFANLHDKPEAAAESAQAEKRRGFFWTSDLAMTMAAARAKAKGPMMAADLMPDVCRLFAKVAESIDETMAKLPKIASLSIQPGSIVAPGTTVLKVTFDRKMVVGRRGIGIQPAVELPAGKSVWSEDGTSVSLTILTKPNTEYSVSLGNVYGPSFESQDGWPFDPYKFQFKTSG